jgi:DNA polymerase III subunit gamma/tau
MSYVVLARKYRPRRFSEMVGQGAVVTALTHALEQNRLHHAYLFTGTRGIGKTTVSRILAKSLNCTGADGQGGITAAPCGMCTACTEIDADRYIDYIELDAASNRGIDEIRDLLERAAYKPSVGRFKIFMIDEAHQLTKDSFNALLKTLEEPPEYLKFVLATTDPEKMLPTVLSRCLQFNLRPMAPETVAEHLLHVLGAERVSHDEMSIRLLARAARGSMRDALSLTDQAIAYAGGSLDADAVRSMLGSVDRSHAERFVRALAARDGRGVLAGVEQAVPGALPETDPDTPLTRALSALLPADETQLLYSFALHGRHELTLAPDAYAGLSMVLLRLLAFAPTPGPAGGAPSLNASPPVAAAPAAKPAPASAALSKPTPRTTHAPPAPTPVMSVREAEPPPWFDDAPMEEGIAAAPVPQPAPASAPLQPTPLGERWVTLVALLNQRQSISALARELAMQAQLIEQRDGAQPLWRLRVERESLRAAAHVEKLRAALAEALGIVPLQLEVEAGAVTDSPAKREAAERERRQREAEAIIHNDPLVKEMLAQFSSARIIPGSIKPRSPSP